MTKIWAEAFWKAHPAWEADAAEGAGPGTGPRPVDARTVALMAAPIAVLAAMTVVIGLYAAPFLELAERAAAELLDPTAYVAAVLGPDAPAVPVETAAGRFGAGSGG